MTNPITKTFTRTLQDLEQLADSKFIREKKFDDLSVFDLKKLNSDDYRHLCKKKLQSLVSDI